MNTLPETTRRLADFIVLRIGPARRLPGASGVILAARTPLGRALKTFLFGVGLVCPLGVVIWALLFWHGSRIAGAAPCLSPTQGATPRHAAASSCL